MAGPGWVGSSLKGRVISLGTPQLLQLPLAPTSPPLPLLTSICNPSPTPPGVPIPTELGITMHPAGARSRRHPLPPNQPPQQSQDHSPPPIPPQAPSPVSCTVTWKETGPGTPGCFSTST